MATQVFRTEVFLPSQSTITQVTLTESQVTYRTEVFKPGQSTITQVTQEEPEGPAATDLPIVGNENLKPPPGAENDGRVAGTPTIPMCARSVVTGTSVGNNNKKLVHVCNFIDEMRKNQKLKKFVKATAQAIREEIRYILKALGLSDKSGAFAYIAAKLKEAARWLKTAQKFLKDVIDFERYVLAYIAKIRGIITWILSLPARFLKMLGECLQKFLKLVSSVMTDFFKELTAGSDSGFSDMISSAKTLVNETVKTVQLATTAAAGLVIIDKTLSQGLLIPASAAEVKAANKTIANYSASLPTTESLSASLEPKPLNTKSIP